MQRCRLYRLAAALGATSLLTVACGQAGAPSYDTDTADAAVAQDTAAAAVAGDTTPVDPATLSAPGPYGVGYRTGATAYAPDDGGPDRNLTLVLWYPTHDAEGSDALYGGLLPQPGVIANAAPAEDLGPRPVVVFSHGNGGFAEQSYFHTEHLASHGYVVASVNHAGNTFFDSGPTPGGIYHLRPADVSAAIDWLEAVAAGDAPIAPLIGTDIAVSGHSFGGYTALALAGAQWDVDQVLAFCGAASLPVAGCEVFEANADLYRAGFSDPRVAAVVPMAPGATFVFGQGMEANTLPTLLITGARDATTPAGLDGDPTWAILGQRASNRRLHFATAGHFTFSDVCALPVSVGEGDGCGQGFIPPERAHAAINGTVLAFLRRHLEGDDVGAALLDGSVSLDEDATLSVGGE